MNKNIAVLVVLVVGLGAALFWWLGGVKSSEVAKESQVEIRPVGGSAAPQRLSAALASGLPIQREVDPKGSLRLEGQVIDDEERSVAGAQVAISSRPPRFAKTEDDGSFVFSGLNQQDYRLEAQRDGLYAAPISIRLQEQSEPAILRMRAGRSIRFSVVADDQDPVEGALVEIRSGMDWHSGLTWTGRSDSAGKALLVGLPTSDVYLVVRASGFASYSGRLPGHALGRNEEHNVVLQRGVAVHGVLVDTSGKPVADARVAAVPASEPFPLVDPTRDGALTDSDGRFALADQMPGSYRFVVDHSKMLAQNMSPVMLNENTSPITLVAMQGGTLEGQVVDSQSQPVAGAEVGYVMKGSVPWRSRRRAISDTEGHFRFHALPPGEADVVATGPSASSEIVSVALQSGKTSELQLVLGISGRIHGGVVDAAGELVPDAQVLIEPVWTGALGERGQWQVRHGGLCLADSGGVFEFSGLPAGDYHLRAAAPGADESALSLATAQPATPGPTKYKLLVAPDVTVSGRLLYQDSSAVPLFSVQLGTGPSLAFADKEGRFAIRMPAGEHGIRFSGPSFAPKAITAKAKSDSDIGSVSVERGRSIAGLVVDEAGSPVEGAQVAAGALLTGDGSKLFIEDESILARTTKTDGNGRFAFDGFGPHAITVVAGLKGRGRSRATQIPPGPSGAEVRLALEPVASLSGTITKDGKPVAETVVIATPIGTSATNFVVTGADGSYAYDALAVGEYMVYPMIGGGGGKPKDIFIKTVSIQSGRPSVRNIDVDGGNAKLEVSVVDQEGKPVAAHVLVIAKKSAPPVPRTFDSLIDGSWLQGFDSSDVAVAVYFRQAMSAPAFVDAIAPGAYSACAAPLASTPGPPSGDLHCKAVSVASGKSARVEVQLPSEAAVPEPQ